MLRGENYFDWRANPLYVGFLGTDPSDIGTLMDLLWPYVKEKVTEVKELHRFIDSKEQSFSPHLRAILHGLFSKDPKERETYFDSPGRHLSVDIEEWGGESTTRG